MSEKNIFKNINAWRELDKNFSLYDYIYHEVFDSKINTDIYFALLELYWPSYVLYDNEVFLKEKLVPRNLEEIKKKSSNYQYWINYTAVDPYFENDDNGDEKAIALSKSLVEIWKIKLKIDFPDRNFTVVYQEDKECGDYGLTFYQI